MQDRHAAIAEVRRFNRFYTRRLGLLSHTLTRSPYTLAEARVLFEIGRADSAMGESVSASEIAAQLHLDPAYLARILKRFTKSGLVLSEPDAADGRRRVLKLGPKGNTALAALQEAANRDLADVLAPLSDDQVAALTGAMHRTTELLAGDAELQPVELRPHRIGDVGWVIEKQSRLYAEEYGWNEEYEALVCEIGGRFLRNFVPGKEFCWVAERGADRLGAVFLVQRSAEDAQLRMLHVERQARGLGIGTRLVDECIGTARAVGYRRIVLWTNDVLTGARRIYERAGFRLVEQQGHHSFGHELHGQTWSLEL